VGSLDGKVAIITGGARGIGRAYALGFAREGARVAIADLDEAKDTVADVENEGGEAMSVTVDVSDMASTENMAGEVAARFGGIDILVNNAGYYSQIQMVSFDQLSVEEWDKAFAVNARGCWLCARAVFPHMKRAGSGKIINISSMTAFKTYVLPEGQGFVHYVASKAAVTGVTRGLAIEMGPFNICVNTLVPEYIPTGLWDDQVDRQVIETRIFKRTQTPEDMVGTALYLAGPGSDFVTGQTLMVNGGTILH
jgi:NAD(P)-dependent dehydrogenase (short-subunit alcohol dehydrogenase family)